MVKWEYKLLVERKKDNNWVWDDTKKSQSSQSRLDEMGNQGWELVAITNFLYGGYTQTYELYFKRPIE